jgi:hypothetical protein
MTLLWAILVVAGVTGLAVGAMLLVRRGAPEGSYFEDGDRASGVFGVLATGFAVLVGFVVFLAFDNYDTSRSGADTEARILVQQFETAQLMPASVRARLSGEVVCFARSVVHQEWPELGSDSARVEPNPWGVAMFRTVRSVEPRSASEQAAFGKWLDQNSDREQASADRRYGADGVIPTPLWIVLFVSASVIFAYMLFFADRGERWFVQAMLMGGVAVVVSSMLLLLYFLDHPYHGSVGSLQPVAMERTLDLLADAAEIVGGVGPPCDERGVERG